MFVEKEEINKNPFDKLDDLQNIAEDRILSNQNLLKLIHYGVSNPLDMEDIDDPYSMIDTDIFLYPIIPDETLTAVKSYLLCDFTIARMRDYDDYINMNVTFTVAIHKALRNVYNNHRRMTMILSELTDMFNRAKGDWLGDSQIISFDTLTTRKDYQSCEITFRMTQFNRKT